MKNSSQTIFALYGKFNFNPIFRNQRWMVVDLLVFVWNIVYMAKIYIFLMVKKMEAEVNGVAWGENKFLVVIPIKAFLGITR